ncbi:hypothetical protein F441_15760 [Phytophthora nicotianae CJ01A1]|uniref:Uncharacterized protein n=4 Tax=Phytophthora nicotianae TaxID=4792 RepID=V9EH58_PHYNI|nr:hypothetical protein F443_15923 [Phytophthora nicotianae P1569]ETO67095.1 hypothetical protein F444_15906 [Phytophthora nicotianae P1976]ETP08207.1 hypothetical protein F441_15760 [Phytophthora nicotianae CJ01A1]
MGKFQSGLIFTTPNKYAKNLTIRVSRPSTVIDGAGVKKKMEQEHEIVEMQLRLSDEKAKTELENKISVVIADAATLSWIVRSA